MSPEPVPPPARPALVWEVTARLRLLCDTHVGAAQAIPRHAAETDVDLHLDRDPRSGLPRLRATTLAGILRHELADRTGDPDGVRALLGSSEPRSEVGQEVPPPAPSALDLDDAPAELPEGAAVAVRAGTRVDPAAGAVLPGRTWQWEVLPAGTVLTAHLRLSVPAPAEEPRLLALLALATAGLDGAGSGAHVGSHSGRGYGAVRAARWSVRRHDLSDEHGWFAYHARTWAERWSGNAAADGEAADLATALGTALTRHGRGTAVVELAARSAVADRRHRAELHLTLAVAERTAPPTGAGAPGPPAATAPPEGDGRGGGRPRTADPDPRPGLLMVGDVPVGDRIGEVDRAHRYRPVVTDTEGPPSVSGGPDHRADPADATGPASVHPVPVLGDTALFSLFKRIAARLLRDAAEHLGGPSARWCRCHAHWWGADTERDPGRGAATPRPSRLRLRSTPVLSGGAPLTATRLTVDSLFGDAVDGRLFTADLHCGGAADVVLDARDPDDALLGLLVLVVRELATVPFETLGAGSGGGNGRLTATSAAVTVHPGDGGPPRTVDLLTAVFTPTSAEAAAARGWLAALHNRLAPDEPTGGEG
ncbi:RAMP superfamily CRISPR-associated protein [Nocardiopsis sp. FIRDI 009]|uniref:RAMP superfamily CRISPR-associated protein n=1 Tax=Nocardiopsis sp. FIRDI 009 TaxID=714197 RepID=UPI000E273C0E|nr:RAMP superfamily CRISPR-associated protein [Nocardiopsis sp. FIRDI 009]